MLRLKIFGWFRAEDEFGKEISIKSRKARALLAYLALPPGKPHSREELMSLLWSDRGDDQARGSLRQALSGLRRDLGDNLGAALRVSDGSVSLDQNRVLVESRSPGDELLEGLHINDSAFEEWLRDERLRLERAAEAKQPQGVTDEPSSKPSIAVLPFVNIWGDPEQEYFADGITEDIITELARFNSLFVISRHSCFHYKGQSPNVQEIGRDLGVRYLVEGSVRRAGKRVRITVQLVDAETGNHLWAERYDRDLEDIFAVQDEVVSSIAMMVPGRVEIATRGRSERRPTSDMTAYDLFLQASHIYYQEYGAEQAVRLLERAMEIDPNYAEAHAHLAGYHAYTLYSLGTPFEDAASKVRRHAQAAVKLAPDNEVVQGAVSEAYLLIGEHDLAAHYCDKALMLNPNNFMVMAATALVKAGLGFHEEGVELIKKAMGNDPFSSASFREDAVEIYYMAGRYQDALDQFIGWNDPPSHMVLVKAIVLAQLGRMPEAKAVVETYENQAPAGYEAQNLIRAYCRTYKQSRDIEHWIEGFQKIGFEIEDLDL